MNAYWNILKAMTRPARVTTNGILGERKVAQKLKELNEEDVEQKVIHNLIFVDSNNKSHQIDHVVIRSNGIFCIETKSLVGYLYGQEQSNIWYEILSNNEKYRLYNPLRQNISHCKCISEALSGKYPVKSVVTLVNNNQRNINSENIVDLRNLKSYLKRYQSDQTLTKEEIDNIHKTLMDALSNMSKNDHIKNIKENDR